MKKKAGTPQPMFDIRAEAIHVSTVDGTVHSIVLFKPEKETLERLQALQQGNSMGGIRLIDKWDDGTDDTHVNERHHSFVNISGSGHGQKTSTWTVTLITARFG